MFTGGDLDTLDQALSSLSAMLAHPLGLPYSSQNFPTRRSPGNRSSLEVLPGGVLSTIAHLVATEDMERMPTSTAIVSFPFVLPSITSHEFVASFEF